MSALVGSVVRGSLLESVLMCGVGFVVNLGFSSVAPILPGHLKQRNLLPHGPNGGAALGSLFSIFSIAALVVMPLAGPLTERFGRFTICGLGILVHSLATLLFGFASHLAMLLTDTSPGPGNDSPCPLMELSLLFIFRSLQSAGGTLASITSTAMALEVNPDSRGLLMGTSETAIGVGIAAGPVIAASVAMLDGFAAPFVVIAAVSMLLLLPLLFAHRKQKINTLSDLEEDLLSEGSEPDESMPRFSPWHSSAAVSICLLSAASMGVFGFLDPTLAPFEENLLKTGTGGVGILFGACSFPYAVLGVAIGAIVDAHPQLAAPLVCVGGALQGLMLALMPAEEPFMGTWAWQLTVLTGLGMASGCGMVPAIPQMMEVLEDDAVKCGQRAPSEDTVLSLIYASFETGQLVGPFIGSYCVRVFGFRQAAQAFGLVVIAIAFVTTLTLRSHGHLSIGRQRSLGTLNDLVTSSFARQLSPQSLHGVDTVSAVNIARIAVQQSQKHHHHHRERTSTSDSHPGPRTLDLQQYVNIEACNSDA